MCRLEGLCLVGRDVPAHGEGIDGLEERAALSEAAGSDVDRHGQVVALVAPAAQEEALRLELDAALALVETQDGIGYIRLSQFTEQADAGLKQAVMVCDV
jgi:hypothetical protein